MLLTPQYGFRSACCYSPIRLGRKKVKNTLLKVEIWVCCKCQRRDVPLVQYNKDGPPQASQTKGKPVFATKEVEDDFHN